MVMYTDKYSFPGYNCMIISNIYNKTIFSLFRPWRVAGLGLGKPHLPHPNFVVDIQPSVDTRPWRVVGTGLGHRKWKRVSEW